MRDGTQFSDAIFLRCYIEMLLKGATANIPEKIKVGVIGFGDQRNPVSEALAEKIQPVIDKL
jgi:hypothetical protein